MGEPRDWEAGGYSVSGQGPAQARAGSWGSGKQAATLRERKQYTTQEGVTWVCPSSSPVLCCREANHTCLPEDDDICLAEPGR